MCIDFMLLFRDDQRTLRKIWRNQEKSITQSAIERSVDKLKKRVFQGITVVACSLFYLVTACYCKLLCSFSASFMVCSQLTNADHWHESQLVLSFSFCSVWKEKSGVKAYEERNCRSQLWTIS